mmetsp:Transcript_10601/g.27670  ORF Transcript_10601/g.27670 Transcript_10601/m.27670 type:complete len:109 (-) Transcript_10601:1199-1525(-)
MDRTALLMPYLISRVLARRCRKPAVLILYGQNCIVDTPGIFPYADKPLLMACSRGKLVSILIHSFQVRVTRGFACKMRWDAQHGMHAFTLREAGPPKMFEQHAEEISR